MTSDKKKGTFWVFFTCTSSGDECHLVLECGVHDINDWVMINSPLPCCEKCQKAGPTTFKISLSWHGGIFYKQFHLLIGITKLTFFRSLLVVKSAPAIKFSPCFLWLISEFWARLRNLLKGQEISEWKYEVVTCPKHEQNFLKNSALNIQDRIFQIFSFIFWANATT